jgi:hypothetical protein
VGSTVNLVIADSLPKTPRRAQPGTNHYRHPTQCRKPDGPVCFSYSRRLSRQTLRHPNINFELSEFSPFGSLSLAQKLGFNSKHTNNKAMQSNDESITMA